MNKQKKQAFTLVELIVVITILAILWTIAFISLQWYSRDSRDSVRISDVSNMKTSLELFHLDAWKYPLPDDADEVTFSGWVLWYQWTFGNQVRKNVSRNMAEVPTDPLMDKEYIYSVLNNRNELEILALLEWDVAAMNDAQVYAWSLEVTPRVDGNYNGLYVKTSDYIVPLPSILTAEDTTGWLEIDANNIASQITHLGDNIPVIWNVASNTWALSGLKLSVYTGSITSESTDEQKVALMDALIWAYSWSSLDNSWLIKTVLSKTGTGDIVSMIDSVVLWDSTNVGSSSFSSSSEWSSITYNMPTSGLIATYLLQNSFTDEWWNYDATNQWWITFVNDSTMWAVSSLDGVDDYINSPYQAWSEFLTHPVTISIWSKRDTSDPNTFIAHAGYRFFIADQDSSILAQITEYNGWVLSKVETTNILTNDWNHIVATFHDKTVILYVNGVYVWEQIWTANHSTDTRMWSNINFWRFNHYSVPNNTKTLLSNIRMYDRVLTQEEVTSIYNLEKNGNNTSLLITQSDCTSAWWYWVDSSTDVYIWTSQWNGFCISPRVWDFWDGTGQGISWNAWWHAADGNYDGWDWTAIDDTWNTTYPQYGQTRVLDSNSWYTCKALWTSWTDFDTSDTIVGRMKWLATNKTNLTELQDIEWVQWAIHPSISHPIASLYIADCIDGVKDLWTTLGYTDNTGISTDVTYAEYNANMSAQSTSDPTYQARQKYLTAWTQKSGSHLPSAFSYYNDGDNLTGTARWEYQVACEATLFADWNDQTDGERIWLAAIGDTNATYSFVNVRRMWAAWCADQSNSSAWSSHWAQSARFVVRP